MNPPLPSAALRPPAPPPLPGHWLLGRIPEQRRDPIAMLMRGLRERGDFVRYRFGPTPVVQLNHPRLYRQVLLHNADAYRKWRGFQRARPVLGKGLVLAEGEAWKRSRRLYQPAFRQPAMDATLPAMVQCIEALLDHWAGRPAGTVTDVLEDTMQAALSIVSRTMISRDLAPFGAAGSEEDRALGRSFDHAIREAGVRTVDLNPLAGLFPSRRQRELARVMAHIHRELSGLVAARRREDAPPKDLLGFLMGARDEETGEAMDDLQLVDELVNILVAGRGTTAIGLAWTWWLLHLHPEWAQAVRDEALAVLGPEGTPGPGDVKRLDVAGRVFQEALRLFPPIWTLPREVLRPDEIEGVPLRPGTIVLVSPYVVHHHPELWPDPERFDPDRFLPAATRERDRLTWMPFGAGPRSCVGGGFAMQEARLFLALTARRFRLVSPRTERPAFETLIGLKPQGGMPMAVQRW